MPRLRLSLPAAALALAAAVPAAAQDRPPAAELEDRVADLEERMEGLARPKPVLKLLDLSLNGLFAAGGSTATEEELESLQGGGHDPHKRGFTVQNVELSISGAVDPHFRGELHLISFIDVEGETAVELEEAFGTTTSLPAGLQVKAGQFFTEFGRHNPTHPHSWEFVDQPVPHTRMFGPDGMRGPGARVSWLLPCELPVELLGTVQNGNGETMTSFLGTEEEEQVGGRPWAAPPVRSPADLVYSGRIQAGADPTPETTALLGLSGAFGPNGTGTSGRTRILGADFTLRWKPLANDHGFPFVSWRTEALHRRFHADEFLEPGLPFFAHETLEDAGVTTQAVWGFRRGWTLGARWDWAEGRHGDPDGDPLRDHRTRGSLALTWYGSEYSKLRLQVNRDRSRALGESTSVWLQFEFLLGAHGAHTF
jgi:hypothetical protein